jgi:hypothetical protein
VYSQQLIVKRCVISLFQLPKLNRRLLFPHSLLHASQPSDAIKLSYNPYTHWHTISTTSQHKAAFLPTKLHRTHGCPAPSEASHVRAKAYRTYVQRTAVITRENTCIKQRDTHLVPWTIECVGSIIVITEQHAQPPHCTDKQTLYVPHGCQPIVRRKLLRKLLRKVHRKLLRKLRRKLISMDEDRT